MATRCLLQRQSAQDRDREAIRTRTKARSVKGGAGVKQSVLANLVKQRPAASSSSHDSTIYDIDDEQLAAKSADLLQDADLHEMVLELQSLLTSRDAAQQAFAKIGQQSLFDFIR